MGISRFADGNKVPSGRGWKTSSSHRRTAMICRTTLALGAMALVSFASSAAMAQNAPPSYEGDPDVYKVIFEDQNFRVIDSLRKKGVHDLGFSAWTATTEAMPASMK
jgi:hypothetical protein